jgi:hypothetical protein
MPRALWPVRREPGPDRAASRYRCPVQGQQVSIRGEPKSPPNRRAARSIISTTGCRRRRGAGHRRRRRRVAHGGAADDQLSLPTITSSRPSCRCADFDAQEDDLRPHAQPGRLYPGPRPRRACLRHRSGRHRQDLSGRRPCGDAARTRRCRTDHPVASGRRGGRAPRLPARRHEGEGRSLSAPALRRALRHDAGRQGRARLAAGVIEIAPLAFMRGRTLANAAVILDEAQNTTRCR